MIKKYSKIDSSKILHIINDAAKKYKGIIPDDCWHEPYMSQQELIDEFNDEVRMYGYHDNNKLIGVIGIQEVQDIILIRHAYTLTSYQNKGTGSAMLEYLLKKSKILVYWWAPGRMPLGQFDFMKNLVLLFIQKSNQLYCLKNIGKYHQNKLKIQ